ncbi:protein grpe [Phtheirospermum japonicum]|uniref:GrpE protein homolog n=1 Tax=Phtheirospermum japonicum TaxID=374723 RepID=A0A830C027_9LAMI|nr:protein grpe [Phtheirospermum japonicum]
MAASASLSSAFSLYTPHSFARSSSGPINYLSPQYTRSTQQFTITTGKPFSRTPFSSYPVLNAYRKFGDSRNINDVYRIDKRSSLKPSVSAWQENQPQQVFEFRAAQSPSDKKFKSSLKPIMQAYKEAILYGDAKTIYEVEDIIFMLEKEKYELDHKLSALSAEASSGKEKYLRVQADFDNYRKRVEKERLNVRNDAKGEVIESLLPMVDSFERAKQQLKIETEMEKKIDTSYQGIYKQFVEIMRSLRVSAVPTVGKPFDPMMHEAIAREESHEFKEGIIIQEFRRGFYLGDRLLRPAMVKVSAGPGKKKPSVPEVAGVDNRL